MALAALWYPYRGRVGRPSAGDGPVSSVSIRVRVFTLAVTAAILFQAGYSTPNARASGAGSPLSDPEITTPQPADEAGSTAQVSDSLSTEDPLTGLKPGASELTSERTEYSQTYANPDGTKTTLFYADPVFYKPEGLSTLEPISTAFVPSERPDGGFVSAAAPVTVSVFDLASTESFLSTTYEGKTIAFALPSSQITGAKALEPIVSGSVADYVGVLPGLDLRVLVGARGPKSFFVWQTTPKEATLRYRVDAPEFKLVPQDDGSIALVDTAGAPVATIPHPYAVDSTPNELFGSGRFTDHVGLALEPDGRTVDVTVDPGWLETATYPVYVDPTLNWTDNAGSTSFGDTFVDSNWPSTNFANYQRPDSPYYHELYNGVAPGYGTSNYDFLKWDLSPYSNSTVDSASLRLYPYHQYYNAPTAETTYVRRVLASWTESGVTWNNKPGYNSTDMATTGCVEAQDCIFNVKAIVQSWLRASGPYSNYGFQVDTIGKGETYWKRFISAEESGSLHKPAFTMTYHAPVTAALYPTGGGPTPATTLTWSYSDAGVITQTQYHVDIATDAGFTQNVVTSGDIAATSTAWAMPSALTAGTTYYWRVKASNGTSWSPFSATASFQYDLANLGLQAQFRTEEFDLGGGDTASVNVVTGDLVLGHPIVALPIRGGALELSATYNSLDPTTVGLGTGWRLNVQRRLTVNADNTITFIDADGARHTFTNPTGSPTVSYTRPPTLYATLTRDTAATPDRFTLTYRDLSKDVFDEDLASSGLLKQVQDRNGNTVTLAYTAGTSRISTITDPAGRSVGFSWSTSPDRLNQIVDWASVAGGILQTSGTGNRTHRFFYDASNRLIGWADGLNTSASCPTGGSHLTCLTYGSTLAIIKTQTVEAIASGALMTSTRVITMQVGLVGGEVVSLKDAEQVFLGGPATTFARAAGQMVVVRPGTPASTTTYGYVAAPDPQARVQSIWRRLGAATIEQRTTYDATYPIEPASVTDDYGGSLAPTVNYTYLASSLGLLSRLDEPLSASNRRYTDYTYNVNNDLTRTLVYQASAPSADTETRYCYTTSGCSTSATDMLLRSTIENYIDGAAGGAAGGSEDVTTTYLYDAYGQRTRSTRANYSGSTLLDSAATGWTYDTFGNVTAEIRNYIDGAVACTGDDAAPNATTNARTDLTTGYTYDTAGNQVSTADPRRAIAIAAQQSCSGPSVGADDYLSRTVYSALSEVVTGRLPTTPGTSDCSPAPACREATTTYDELGLVRESSDYGGLVIATKYDRDGRAIETYEDVDGSGGVSAALTSANTYDADGRLVTAKDRRQTADGSLGSTVNTYDNLGRVTSVKSAYTPPPAESWLSETATTYDTLDRKASQTIGYGTATAQTTMWTYDIGGRVTELNDEFTCTTTTSYDYRDLAIAVVEGKTPGTPCTGTGTRTVTSTYDGLGRLLTTTVTGSGDVLTNNGYDGAGRTVATSQVIGSIEHTTQFTFNALDQQIVEYRHKWVNPVMSEQTWLQSNYDAAGNNTDRCSWVVGPTVACLPADQAMTPEPVKRTTSGYDARSNRISFLDPTIGETTYDPAANYAVKGVYTKTAAGREHQAIHAWDARNRLDSITHYVCATAQRPVCTDGNILSQIIVDDYGYDDNDNRTQAAENNGATMSTKYFCYDAVNRLIGTYSAQNCASPVETYAYDAAGNRTSVAGRTFTYDAEGQLASCTTPACTASHDAEGRLTELVDNGTTWTYQYDAEGRLTAACKSSSCSGSIDRLDFAWGDAGQRVQITETTQAGAVTTTDLRYEGAGVVQEVTSTGIIRTFTLDEAGSIVKVTIVGDVGLNNGTYVVTWSGHGDALALWQIDPSTGGLTLANSYIYSSWGQPTTATHNGYGDLHFRYLYVGRYGVTTDGFAGANLLLMGARHYSAALGRFLQPDPSAAEANLYAYAENSPVTKVDPTGTSSLACQVLLAKIYLYRYTLLVKGLAIKLNKLDLPRFGSMSVEGHRLNYVITQRHLNQALDEYQDKCNNRPKPPGDCRDLVKAPAPFPIYDGRWNHKPSNNPWIPKGYQWSPRPNPFWPVYFLPSRSWLPFWLFRIPDFGRPLPAVG
jgi:RHS repeat-associated protein